MARVPGLRPVPDDRPAPRRGRPRGRVQAPTVSATPGLRPVASPVDTYSRPQRPSEDNTLLRLASGLAAVQPSLTRFLDAYAEDRKTEAEARAASTIGGMTFEEARQAREDGLPEMNDPWFQAAFEAQYAQRLALWRQTERLQDYATNFDRQNGDVDPWLRDAMSQDLGSLDPKAQAAYARAMAPFAARIQGQHTLEVSERMAGEARQGVYETLMATAREGLGQGHDPATIHAAMRAFYQGNRDLLRVSYRDQDLEMLRVAAVLAEEGHHDLVRDILTGDRGGIGPLANVREHAQAATDLLTRAERERDRRRLEGGYHTHLSLRDAADRGEDVRAAVEQARRSGGITDAQALGIVAHAGNRRAALARQAEAEQARVYLQRLHDQQRNDLRVNDLATLERGLLPFLGPADVLDRSGNPTVLSADRRREEAVRNYLEVRSPQIAQARDETPEQTVNRLVDVFSRNGQVNPEWESILRSGYAGATAWTTSGTNGDIPPALEGGLALYFQLHAANPRLLAKHLDSRATQFYEAFRVATQFGGMDRAQALAAAQRITDPIEGPQRIDLARKEVEGALSNLSDLGNEWFDGRGDVENLGAYRNTLRDLAQFYVSLGMGTEQALEQAQARIQATHVQVNGWMIPAPDRRLPPTFPEMAEQRLRAYAEAHGDDEGLAYSDLTILPVNNGTGAWRIVTKSGHMVEHPQDRVFTLDTLIRDEQARLEAERAAEEAEAVERQTHRLDPWYTNQWLSIGPMNLNGWTPQEVEEINRRRDAIREAERLNSRPDWGFMGDALRQEYNRQ